MDPMTSPIADTDRTLTCPNCGNQQAISGVGARCEQCGYQFDPSGSSKEGIVGTAMPGQGSPFDVPPAMASGGIGGVNDGTQVTHHVSTPVPGKPMAPIADDPAGGSTLEGQALDPPASGAHAERGGSG